MLYRYHLFRHKFCVFLKLRFSDKRFSFWLQACHKIILPVRMLRMLRTLFCRDTSFFFILTIFDFDFCRFPTYAVSRLSTLRLFDSSTRRSRRYVSAHQIIFLALRMLRILFCLETSKLFILFILALAMEHNLPNWMTLFSVSVKSCAQR